MNINDIAGLAGVSRSTVSRFLNGGYVSSEKAELIGKVIEETGFVPSSRAQTLRTGKTHLVGVIIPKISSETISREVAGISDELRQAGYSCLLANTDNDAEVELSYLRVLNEKRVDGIILIGTLMTSSHLNAIRNHSVPVVVLGQRSDTQSCVFFDDYGAMHAVATELLKGASHPALIGVTEQDESVGLLRKQAFLDACEEAGIERDATTIVESGFDMLDGKEATMRLLDEHPRIDAIACATDTIAVGCMKALYDRGISVPDEIAVSGIGDSSLGEVMQPPLTTAHLHYDESGSEAARLLVSMMRNGHGPRRELKMGYRLVVRESTRS
ncbi:MAG: LacI family DNA-binding transcriptional regulator [Atopobiaceae bacterium]|nr:LacI family DNA-binding transcriptional regulator [Atopobiaceae bacterium]